MAPSLPASTLPRRRFLASAGAWPFLPALLHAAASPASETRSLILLWMDGGMSHLDTFDGKPEAPPDIRGDLGSVESAVPGVFVSEHFGRLRHLMRECALVRSLTSPEGNHDRGSHYMLTGRRPSPTLRYPSFGSLLEEIGNAAENPVPPYVAIPDAHPFAREGFLPASRAPFELGSDPSRPEFAVRNLEPGARAGRIASLVHSLDALDGPPRSSGEAARDLFLRQAFRLSLQPEIRERFDLSREPPENRARFGHHFLGQACLLARRLVEGGVRTVLVRYTGWDHHQGIARALNYGFPPRLEAVDQAVAALHDDLRESGLLERTVVLLASEFGRTPRLNPAGGRDHWSRASSALLFGAGIRRGAVAGATDARGEEPVELPVTPSDLFATVLTALGADPGRTLTSPEGRPVRLVDAAASPLREVLEA